MVIELTEENYNKAVEHGNVIVKFGASWCGPCRKLAPVYEALSEKVENLTFSEVSIDDSGELARSLGIKSIPTMILYRDGKEVQRAAGSSENTLQELVSKVQ